ncbi:MAG: aldo/keto reductase [Marinilabiliales bacterium]|nr:aldo/keto reductase [Marinilabiliales bacterium]
MPYQADGKPDKTSHRAQAGGDNGTLPEKRYSCRGLLSLATGRILENPFISAIAKKYGRSVAQISVRYVLQKGALPLPKSTHPEYIKQNFDIDFKISQEDMLIILTA